MRTLFSIILALLLPVTAFNVSADDENAKMKIPLRMESTGTPVRNIMGEPVVCHYYGTIASVVTTVSSDVGNVTLTVTNTSTGEVWYDVFDSSLEFRVVLTISGTSGVYEVLYETEHGEIYLGNFII